MGPLHITAEDQRLKNRIANVVEEAWHGEDEVIIQNGTTVFIERVGDTLSFNTCGGDNFHDVSLADAPAAILKLLQG